MNTFTKILTLFTAPVLLGLLSCQTSKQTIQKEMDSVIGSPVFEKNFTGLVLYDPENQEEIYNYNADKYFNPASNTKLFTFFGALNILGDSIPALEYFTKGDSLVFRGTGDPSFLNADVETEDRIFNFLDQSPHQLFYAPNFFSERRYGPGWAWDDFNDYYATEKAEFPIYGNVVRFTFPGEATSPEVTPPYFYWGISLNRNKHQNHPSFIQREEHENTFYYSFPLDTATVSRVVPFKYTPELFVNLLSDTLSKPVRLLPDSIDFENAQLMYSISADSLYKRMLQASDNFIAEQILLLCAGEVSDTLDTRLAIEYIKKNFLSDLPDELRWVDGSGLSRYNLFTPRSIVKLLEKINAIVPRERLFELLPAGGKSGNLKDSFKADEPFIFAKSGTLSNNYCLSGYLLTRSGRLLIFSFMNNNYIIQPNIMKREVEKSLRNIYERY